SPARRTEQQERRADEQGAGGQRCHPSHWIGWRKPAGGDMAKYDVARWDELDGVVKKVRRALGVTGLGGDCFALPPGAEGLEHNETQTNQEEVYVYVRGSGRLRIDGREIDVGEGRSEADTSAL